MRRSRKRPLDNAGRQRVEILHHMRTLVLRKFRLARLFLFCFLSMLAALSIAMAQDQLRLENARDFWVTGFHTSPPSYRKLRATLRASGNRSLIYVEDKIWGKELNPDFMNRLLWRLESAMPSGAVFTDTGIVPFEEGLFGPLPRKFPLGEERLVVLFADFGPGRAKPRDAVFNAFDQLSDSEARAKYQQRSNEGNIIYVNGFRKSEDHTVGVIAHELQHLLAKGNSLSEREVWLSETLAEGAMLLTGHFTHQSRVNELALNPGLFPLVSFSGNGLAAQLLFSSFLLDSVYASSGFLAALSNASEPGKAAVEKVFREQTGAPLTFDALYSNFVSYVFGHSTHTYGLPQSWSPKEGIRIPAIQPYFTYKSSSGELVGQMPPYSFLAIDLAQELSPKVLIQTERVQQKEGLLDPKGCASTASVLWKPIAATRIAIYSVGCDPKPADELVSFRLKILDQPSLIPTGSFKILR